MFKREEQTQRRKGRKKKENEDREQAINSNLQRIFTRKKISIQTSENDVSKSRFHIYISIYKRTIQ
jgi:hypothetical protein